MSEEETTKNRGGRPPTGITPKRQVRVGDEWDEADRLALLAAERLGLPAPAPGRNPYLAEYITEALRLHNNRINRWLAACTEADQPSDPDRPRATEPGA